MFIVLGHFGEVRKANLLKFSSDVAVVAVKTIKGNYKYCLNNYLKFQPENKINYY